MLICAIRSPVPSALGLLRFMVRSPRSVDASLVQDVAPILRPKPEARTNISVSATGAGRRRRMDVSVPLLHACRAVRDERETHALGTTCDAVKPVATKPADNARPVRTGVLAFAQCGARLAPTDAETATCAVCRTVTLVADGVRNRVRAERERRGRREARHVITLALGAVRRWGRERRCEGGVT